MNKIDILAIILIILLALSLTACEKEDMCIEPISIDYDWSEEFARVEYEDGSVVYFDGKLKSFSKCK